MGIEMQLYTLWIEKYKSGIRRSHEGLWYTYRVFATLFIVTIVRKLSAFIHQRIQLWDDQMLTVSVYVWIRNCSQWSWTVTPTILYGTSWNETTYPYCLNNYCGFTQVLLILSRDIESNPGPTDMDTILQAIESSEYKVLDEIRFVRSEIVTIKNNVATLKSKQIKTKLDINEIQNKQIKTTRDIIFNVIRTHCLPWKTRCN